MLPSILVIDGDFGVVNAFKKTLPRWGFAVAGFASIAQGFEALKKEKPQALILDIQLPINENSKLLNLQFSEVSMPVSLKRMTSIWQSSFILILALLIATGCGGKKTLKMTETPAPQATATEPVARPERVEKAAPEIAKKETAAPILETVYFDYDKYDLTPAAREVLAVNAQGLRQNSEAPVVIEGHCDERGTVEYSLALGDKRAKAVKDYLVWLGVDY